MNKIRNIFSKIKSLYRKTTDRAAKLYLRIKLAYLVRWARRACVKDKCMYYILLDTPSRQTMVVDGKQYASMKKYFKKHYKRSIRDYVYAIADPWRNKKGK